MGKDRTRIAVTAPANRIEPALAERIKAIAAAAYPDRTPDIHFHPQCFLSSGHFAGEDTARADAFVEMANDENFDALWIARGGYGACRIAPDILQRLGVRARRKTYLGYSDAGFLLAGLYRAGFENVVHGPMPADARREGGEEAIRRSLAYLVERDPRTVEGSISASKPVAAFNITALSQLLGTELQPDLTRHVLMLEEVSEALYRIDRSLFHITSNPGIRKVAGIRLGRCSDITRNEPDFGMTEEEIARYWCRKSGIPYLGRADIGHDIGNKIVPFGRPSAAG